MILRGYVRRFTESRIRLVAKRDAPKLYASHSLHLLYDVPEVHGSQDSGCSIRPWLLVVNLSAWTALAKELHECATCSAPYLKRYCERLLASTAQLEDQGDGMRSFASVILPCSAYSVHPTP